MVSLAAADLLAGLATYLDIALENALQLNTTYWLILCKTKLGFTLLSLFGNVYNILFVTIDRALYMVKPMRYASIVTTCRASVTIFCLWSAIAIHVLMLLIFDYDIEPGKKYCTIPVNLSKTGTYILVIQYSIIVFGIILPCYCKIIHTIRHLRRTEPHVTNLPPEQQLNQIRKLKERSMAVTMGWVFGTFFICNVIPFVYNFVVARVFDFDPFSFNAILSSEFFQRIFWTQFLLNTFIYGWRNKSFRKAYKKLFCIPQTNSVGMFP